MREVTLNTLPSKKRELGTWLFFAFEAVIAYLAVIYGFVAWYVEGFIELTSKPIASLSMLDIASLTFRFGLLLMVAVINYMLIKSEDSDEDCL